MEVKGTIFIAYVADTVLLVGEGGGGASAAHLWTMLLMLIGAVENVFCVHH